MRFFPFLYITNPSSAAEISVTGYANHTPVIFHKEDRINAVGIIKISPLSRDKICAGKALSIDVKKVARIILYPTNGVDIKYSFSPVTAIV